MKHTITLMAATLLLAACNRHPDGSSPLNPQSSLPCAEALVAYAERYPAAEPTDLYKLVFQDLYGPGHMVTDSASCAAHIEREAATMGDTTALPPYEYTLCDSHYVRVNLLLVRQGKLPASQLASAVVRSNSGLNPDPRFVMSHSEAFRNAYRPHYRIVRRDLFERELLPLCGSRENAD